MFSPAVPPGGGFAQLCEEEGGGGPRSLVVTRYSTHAVTTSLHTFLSL